MVVYLEKLEHAKKNIKVADHMLTITHNVVNDPKLLLLVLQKVQNSLQNCLAALLYYDLYYRRIPPFKEDFGSMLDIFRVRNIRRYSMDEAYVKMLNDVHITIKHQKQGSVEFKRQDKYVICSEMYDLNVITKQGLTSYIQQTKSFIKDIQMRIIKE